MNTFYSKSFAGLHVSAGRDSLRLEIGGMQLQITSMG